MRHGAGQDDDAPASAGSGRAVAVLVPAGPANRGPLCALRRPDAGFLAQLLASGDPTLRTSRIARTRSAAAHYAAAARCA